MDQMKEALMKALGPKALQKAASEAAKANPRNCDVCGDVLTDEHDGSQCRQMMREAEAG